MKRMRLQNADRSVDRCQTGHDARMGFHICVVGYVLGMPVASITVQEKSESI